MLQCRGKAGDGHRDGQDAVAGQGQGRGSRPARRRRSGRGFKRDRETHISFICSYYHRVPADLNSVSKKMFCWSAFQTIAVVIVKFLKLIFN